MKSISYFQTLRNRLETIDSLMQEIYEKGPPFPPELWIMHMRWKQAALKTRILENRNAAGRDTIGPHHDENNNTQICAMAVPLSQTQ